MSRHAIAVEGQRAVLEPLAGTVLGAQGLDAAEQRRHACEQVLDAGAFREVIIGAEAQPRHGIELALASRQEDDRQLHGSRAQLTAKLETALYFGAEVDVDDDEVWKAALEAGERLFAAAVADDAITLAAQAGQVVVADRDLVFDDGYELGGGHGLSWAPVPPNERHGFGIVVERQVTFRSGWGGHDTAA